MSVCVCACVRGVAPSIKRHRTSPGLTWISTTHTHTHTHTHTNVHTLIHAPGGTPQSIWMRTYSVFVLLLVQLEIYVCECCSVYVHVCAGVCVCVMVYLCMCICLSVSACTCCGVCVCVYVCVCVWAWWCLWCALSKQQPVCASPSMSQMLHPHLQIRVYVNCLVTACISVAALFCCHTLLEPSSEGLRLPSVWVLDWGWISILTTRSS